MKELEIHIEIDNTNLVKEEMQAACLRALEKCGLPAGTCIIAAAR